MAKRRKGSSLPQWLIDLIPGGKDVQDIKTDTKEGTEDVKDEADMPALELRDKKKRMKLKKKGKK